jgi:GNAT superfamily N-acetyltransferase
VRPEFHLLTRRELDTVLEWAAAEGWNPGLDDAEAFWAADPEGFYGMRLDGKLIGSASIVSYSGKQGFLGLFIVRPEWRGKGLGKQFWNFLIPRMLERLDPGAPASLDGVFAMQTYYAKSGFVYTHRNLRMEGVGSQARPDSSLVKLGSPELDEVVGYDALHFGTPRPDFWKYWIRPRGGIALALPDKRGLAGIGVVRPCARGFKIGPLFAESPVAANAIFEALSNFAQGQPLFLDTPECNPQALALAERHGMKESFGCARMVMGATPETPWEKIYGVTTFELG